MEEKQLEYFIRNKRIKEEHKNGEKEKINYRERKRN